MIGSIVGAVTGLAGSIYGGIKANKAMKKANKILDQQEKDNKNWYDRRYNESYTQTAEAQAALNKAKEAAREQFQRASGVSAVTGATDESVAHAKDSANDMIADTTTGIAIQGNARKDDIESQYMNTKKDLANQRIQLYTGQAQNATSAAGQSMQAGMGLLGADLQSILTNGKGLFSNLFKKP